MTGFQIINPLEHCSECNTRFTEREVQLWRTEFGAGEDPDVDEGAQVLPLYEGDFPDLCLECVEIDHMHNFQLRCAS